MRPRRARSVGRAVVAAALLVGLLGGEPAVDPVAGATHAAAPSSGPPAPAAAHGDLAARAAAPSGAGRPAPSPGAARITSSPGSPSTPDSLVTPPGATGLVSVAGGGGFPNGVSATPSASSSGRYVAFASTALDIVPGGTSGVSAVFVRDRSTGTTIVLPAPGGGPVPKGASATAPTISADGTVVAFVYQTARELVAHYSTVVVWSRATGATTPVSTALLQHIDRSREPAVSADGRYIAFTYDHGDGTSDVYRYDRSTGAVVLVSAGPGGSSAGGSSSLPAISGDGSVVAFSSSAGQSLVGGATGSGTQVFARDLNAGTTELVSVGAGGAAPNKLSSEPSVSDDGRYVAFASAATNLVSGTSSAPAEVYRRDRQTNSTVLVSAVDGTPNPYASSQPAISRDGRMVAYVESQPSLAAALLVRQVTQLYLYDVPTQRSVLISENLSGQASGSINIDPSIAGYGRYVAFASTGPDLVPGDANGRSDVFIRDLPPVPRLEPAVIDFGTRSVGVSPGTAAGVLSNAGWAPLTVNAASIAGKDQGDFSVLADGCAGQVLHGGEACTVTVGFAPTQAGVRSAKLEIADSYTGSPRTAALTGSGSSAKIVLDPPLGPPGIVVIATGSGFPAGAQITLSWSVGITPVMPVVTADAKGRFEVPVLVMRNDQVGQRDLLAAWAGGPQFPTLQTPMLVTIAPAAPPRFLGAGSLQSLVFRG
jgi:Tol biopolymer transport system component